MASADTTITTTGFGAYDVPADVMWPVVSSWPAIWITEANSPAAVKDVVGEGVGAKRTVFMRDGSGEWGEEITAMDAAGMTWSYKLLSALPGPFAPIDHTKFTCTMSVVKQGDGCKVTISATGVPAELSPMIQGMYTAWTLSMAGLASKTIANFFVIEHTFKAGKADEWWGKFAQIMGEPDGMAKMTQAQHDNGFHNHSFMPGIPADSTAHCVWEAAPGKTAADMQAFTAHMCLSPLRQSWRYISHVSRDRAHSSRGVSHADMTRPPLASCRPSSMASSARLWGAWTTLCWDPSTPRRYE